MTPLNPESALRTLIATRPGTAPHDVFGSVSRRDEHGEPFFDHGVTIAAGSPVVYASAAGHEIMARTEAEARERMRLWLRAYAPHVLPASERIPPRSLDDDAEEWRRSSHEYEHEVDLDDRMPAHGPDVSDMFPAILPRIYR